MIKSVSKITIEHKQPDLLYLEPILASTGPNSNKQLFLPEELFAAINTPLFKPVDWEHHGDETDESTEIIGTITNAWFEDFDGKKIEATEFKDMPGEFNIVTNAVIWKYLFSKRAKLIEERYEDDDLWVSLEAWFTSYDYAIKDGEDYKIIKRNKTTASLDKYLVDNKGPGKINGRTLYRVPRNITFGGLGIVKKPANKKSEVKDLVASARDERIKIVKPDATKLVEKLIFH